LVSTLAPYFTAAAAAADHFNVNAVKTAAQLDAIA